MRRLPLHPHYNRENACFLLDRPGHSPYIYDCQVLGMYLDTQSQTALFRYNEAFRAKIFKRFRRFVRAMWSALLNSMKKQHVKSGNWQRTVYINTLNVGATSLDISTETKGPLVE